MPCLPLPHLLSTTPRTCPPLSSAPLSAFPNPLSSRISPHMPSHTTRSWSAWEPSTDTRTALPTPPHLCLCTSARCSIINLHTASLPLRTAQCKGVVWPCRQGKQVVRRQSPSFTPACFLVVVVLLLVPTEPRYKVVPPPHPSMMIEWDGMRGNIRDEMGRAEGTGAAEGMLVVWWRTDGGTAWRRGGWRRGARAERGRPT